MGNMKFPFIFVISFFVTIGLYAGFSPAYGQEGEEINPKKLFEYHCSTCHDEDGKGTKRGHELKAPNLADAKWQVSQWVAYNFLASISALVM